MLLPLYAFVEGDTLGLLMLAQDSDSVRSLAERMARSAGARIDVSGDAVVVCGGVELKSDDSLARAGLRALDRVDLRRRRRDA